MRSGSIYFVIAALLAGCDSALAPSEEVRVETLASTVARSPVGAAVSALVPFRVANEGDAPIFIARCGGRVMTAVDRHESGQGWEQYSGDACIASLDMTPIELASGAQVESDRWLDEPGVYRLRVGSSTSPGGPVEWRTVSNTFVVR